MLRLALILHIFIGSTVMGTAVIVALVANMTSMQEIFIAAGIGFLVSIPMTGFIAKQLYDRS